MKTLEDVLEEITPTPDPDFVADMEWRMRRGFPEPQRQSRLPRVALPSLRPRALAAVVASGVLALLVTVALLDGDEPQPDRPAVAITAGAPASGGGGGTLTAPAASDRRRAQAEQFGRSSQESVDSAALQSLSGEVAPGAQTRRVERSAQLTLAAEPTGFDALADSIFRVADRRDGFVLRSSFTQGEDGPSGGFFELRIPSSQLPQALNELSGLATVRARSESGNDVTAQFVSVRDRLRTALAERKSLLRRLELATTETAAAAVRRRLAIVGRKIASLRGQLRGARERTQFATVLVELIDEDIAGAAPGETDKAFDDAVGSLEDILNFLIRALGVLLPVALTALVVWLAASWARRRARERALA